MGRGLGWRQEKKTLVGACKALTVNNFRPRHWASGTITWDQHRQQTGQIGFTIVGEQVTLSYSAGRKGEPPQQITEHIVLSATKPHYGGVRWWLCCPGCGKRCYYLYLPPTAYRFRCRSCHQLTYQSTQEWDKRVGWYLANIERAIPVLEFVESRGLLMRGAMPAFRAEYLYLARFDKRRERKKRRNERRRARYAERKGVR